MDFKELQNFIKFVTKSGASEVSLETDNFKVTVKTSGAEGVSYVTAAPAVMAASTPAAPAATAAAAATADGSATSDLQDLKLLSYAQARLSNIVQVRAAASWQNCDSSELSTDLDSERAAAVQNAATGASSGAGQLAACGRPVVPVPRPSVAARQPALPSPHARTHR